MSTPAFHILIFLSAVAFALSVAACNGSDNGGGGGLGMTPPPASSNSLRLQSFPPSSPLLFF